MGVAGGPSIPQSGLQLCLDAGNTKSSPGSGTTWSDVSGNDKDFTWSSAPTYNAGTPKSIDAALCSGPDSDTFGITSSTGASFVFICLNESSTAKSAFKWYMGDGTGNDGRGYFAHLPWNNAAIYFDTNGSTSTASGGGRVISVASWGALDTWATHGFTKSANGAIQTQYRDGVLNAQHTNKGACPTLSDDGATIGGDDVYTSGWDAKMGLFLCYNRELTAAEILQIHNAFRQRY